MYYLDMVYGYNYYILSRYGLWSLSLEREEMWPRQNMPILNTLL